MITEKDVDDYEAMTRKELIEEILSLKRENKEMKHAIRCSAEMLCKVQKFYGK